MSNSYLEEIPACKICPIRLHRQRLREKGVKFNDEYLKEYAAVPATYIQGSKSLPPILFVGEAPGDSEEKAIVPFVGIAGQLLRKTINHVLSSEEVISKIKEILNTPEINYKIAPIPIYFSNSCKCRPVGEDGKFRTPHVDEIKHCNPRLINDIKEIKPLVVVALGKTASIALNISEASRTKFDDLRGRTFSVHFGAIQQTLPVFVTYHPSKITRSKMKLAKIYYDDFKNIFNLYVSLLEKEKKTLKKVGKDKNDVVHNNLRILYTTKEITHYLGKILQQKPYYISIDYETSPIPWGFVPEEVKDFHKVTLDVHNPLNDICFVSIATKGKDHIEAVSFPLCEREVLEKHLKKAEELEQFYTQNRINILKDVENAYKEFLKTGSSYVALYDLSRKYRLTGPIDRNAQKSIIYLLAEKFENSEHLPLNEAITSIRRYLTKKIDELIHKIRKYRKALERATVEYENTFDIDPKEIKPLLKKVLLSRKIYKIIMNPVFEEKFSRTKLGTEISCFVGIDILDHLLGALQPSLEDLKRRYLPNIEVRKKDFLQVSISSDTILKEYAYYNAFDAFITYEIFEKEKKEIENLTNITVNDFKKERTLSECIFRAHRFYREVVVPLIASLEINGIRYDVERSLSFALELRHKARELERKGFELLKTYVPYVEPQKARLRRKEGREILYKAYEREPIYTEKGELSVSADALKHIYETTSREEVRHAMLYFHSALKMEKIISTYLEKYPYYVSPYTGNIHSSYQITRTATGRLAATGPNIQQVPREGIRVCPECGVFPFSDKDSTCPLCEKPFEETIFLKELFIPNKGNTLIVADYSQMEVRLLAELASDEKLLSAIAQGLDMHSYNASSAFGVPYEEIYENKDTNPEMKRLRQLAKKITFAIAYGSTPEGIAETVDITVEEAKKMIENFLKNHQNVRKYINFCHKHAGAKRCIVTPIGRVRWFLHCTLDPETGKPKEPSICREAQNTPIQSISSDINLVAAELERRKNHKVKVVGLIHDSIITEVPNEEVNNICEELKTVMEEEVKVFLKEKFGIDLLVKLKADIGKGKNWKEATP